MIHFCFLKIRRNIKIRPAKDLHAGTFGLERAVNPLKRILEEFKQRVYNEKSGHLEVFFDAQMNTISDLYSYGHDIEASWLPDRACGVPADAEFTICV